MKRILIKLILIFLTQNFLFSQTFEKVSTPFKFVHGIKFLKNNLLFVAGDSVPIDIYAYSSFIPYSGCGFYLSEDFGKTYKGPYLEGKTVFDLTQSQTNLQTYYASGFQFTRGSIFKSIDGAKSWDNIPMHEDVKLYQKITSNITPDNKEVFIVTSPNSVDGLYLTQDNFETLNISPVLNTQVYDFKVSKKVNSYFMATDNSTFGHVARLSANGLEKDVSGLEGLRVLCVQPSEYFPGYVYCGADSITSQKVSIGKGIFYSIDTGKTWKPLTAAGYQVFEIFEHPSDPNFMAAACGKIGVGISGNYGKWFDTFSDGLPADFDVRKVAIPNIVPTSAGIQVYASLLNDGLYKSKNITSPVNDYLIAKELQIIQLYPIPVKDNLTLVINSPISNAIQINFIDLLGNTVFWEKLENLNIGINVITLNEVNMKSGKYFMMISDSHSQITKPIIILK